MKEIKRILIVEDETIIAQELKLRLENLGYQVCAISFSGPKAIQLVDEMKPDLVLMDIILHGEMDGIETVVKIHERTDIPVIYLTAHSDEKTLERAKKTEPYGYMLKPYQDRELKSMIDTAFYKHEIQKKLKESESKYRQVVENASDIIFTTDTNGNFLFSNTAGLRISGYSIDEITKLNYLDLVIPEYQRRLRIHYMKQYLKREDKSYFEYPFRAKDGSIRWFGQNVNLIIKDNDVVGYHCIARDITERIHFQEALRESEEKYRAIVEDQTEMICRFKPDCTLTFVNESYARNWGKSPDELVGVNFLTLIPERAHENIQKHFNSFTPANAVKIQEHEVISRTGEICWQQWSNRAFFDEEGNIIEYQSVGRNITERKLAEAELKHETKFRDVLGNIANEFINTSLSKIDKSVDRALEAIGNFVGADRSYVIRFDFKTGKLYNTHEWCREGIQPQIDNLQDIPIDMFSWVNDQLIDLQVVHIPRISDLPAEASVEKEEFEAENIQSLLLVPLVSQGKCVGTIGFDFVNQARYCSESETRLLQLAGATLSNALDRKQVEEAFRESEVKYRTLTDNLNVGVYRNTLGLKGKFLEANPAMLEIFGYKYRNDFLKLKVADLYQNREDRKMFNEKMLKQGFVRNEELRLQKKDGTPFIGSVSAVAVKDETGMVRYYDGIIEDITERKRSEEALLVSEEKFRTLAERSPNMIFINKMGRVVYANKISTEALGYSRDEFYSPDFDFLTIIAPEFTEKVKSAFGKHKKREDIEPYEYALITKDGKRIEAILTSKVIDFEGDNAILGIVTDITDRKRWEEQIQKDLKEKEILIKEIHHRVKNNLQILESLASLQSQYIKNKQVISIFNGYRDRIRSMALVHEQLYSSPSLARINLEIYIKDLADHLQWAYSNEQVTITYDFDIDNVIVDINMAIPIGIIVNELITNALKHAFPPSWRGKQTIRIGLKRKKTNNLELTVSDNGVGVPEEIYSDKLKSFGLLLVTILGEDQLGGKIKLKREKGTTFIVNFKIESLTRKSGN